jgi:hypothetical protein
MNHVGARESRSQSGGNVIRPARGSVHRQARSVIGIAFGAGFWLLGCATGSHALQLPSLAKVDSIRISDDWTGLSPVAPLERDYFLKRQGKGFSGTANFSVAGYSGQPRTATANIQIPAAAAKKFLELLASSPLKAGDYTASINHTDDYPHISVELMSKDEIVRFFTQSQGRDHVPWGAKIKEKTYVISSDAPARALKTLEPYLKRDILERLIDEVPSGPKS